MKYSPHSRKSNQGRKSLYIAQISLGPFSVQFQTHPHQGEGSTDVGPKPWQWISVASALRSSSLSRLPGASGTTVKKGRNTLRVSNPWGKDQMKSQFESRAASSTSSRVASGEPYAMFSWTVPAKRMGSWKTTPIRSRQDSGVKDRMSAIAKVSRQLCRCSEQAPLTCTVERYSPLVRIIKPAQKLFYRGLPTTARSPTDRQFTHPSHLCTYTKATLVPRSMVKVTPLSTSTSFRLG